MSYTDDAHDDEALESKLRSGPRRQYSSGESVTFKGRLADASDTVADTFTYRKHLVVLDFAQMRIVVSIKNTEVTNAKEAVELATTRATRAYRKSTPVGDLIKHTVYEDTPENRTLLKLDGEYDTPRRTLESLWRNAA